MTSDDKWQGYFGQMFEGREVPPEDRLWQNIASKIPNEGGPKKPRGLWWYFPLAVVLLSLIGWGVYEMQPNESLKGNALASADYKIASSSTDKDNLQAPSQAGKTNAQASSSLPGEMAEGKRASPQTLKGKEFIAKANASGAQASLNEIDNLTASGKTRASKASNNTGLAGILPVEATEGDPTTNYQLKPQKPGRNPKGNIRDRQNLGRTFLLAGPILQHGGRGKDSDNQEKPKNLQGLAIRSSKPSKGGVALADLGSQDKGSDETGTDSPYRNSGILEPMLIPILETRLTNSILGPEAKLAQADSTLPEPKGLIDSLVEKAKAKKRTTLYGIHAAAHQMMQTTYIRGFESIHISEGQNPGNSAMQTFSVGLTAMRRVAPKTDVRVRFDYFRLQQAFSGGANSSDASNFTTSWLSADSFGVQPLYQKGTYAVTKTYHLGLFSMGVQQWLYNGLYIAADAGIGYNLGSNLKEEHRGYNGNASPLQPGSADNNFGMMRLGLGYRRNLGKGWMMQMEPAIQWYPKIGGLKGDLDFKSRSVGLGITFLR